MNADEQLADLGAADGGYAASADWFTQESGYLPPKGDQSWRELEAMRIVPAYEMFDAGQMESDDSVAREQAPESDSTGWGLKGVIFALFSVPVVTFAIVALTSPGILSAILQRMHWGEAGSLAKSAGAPVSTVQAPVPVPLAEREPPPQIRLGPVIDQGSSTAPAASMTPPPSQPAPAIGRDLSATLATNAIPDTNAVPEAAPKPSPRPVKRATRRNDPGTSGFYAMVAEPDGTLEYRYFPSHPSH